MSLVLQMLDASAASVLSVVLIILLLSVLLAVRTDTVVVIRVFFSPGDLTADLVEDSCDTVTVTSPEHIDTSVTVNIMGLAAASSTTVIRTRMSLRESILRLCILEMVCQHARMVHEVIELKKDLAADTVMTVVNTLGP